MREHYGEHKNEKYYITTAIAYASGKPHIGNTYEVIMTDAVARFRRQLGSDVFFCTGTDEHGEKIENLAAKEGITPKQLVDRVAGEVRALWDLMNTSYDHFIRTTDAHHEAAVAHVFKEMYERGDIYKGTYEGWYCVPCESFLTDTQVVGGVCPDCGRPVERKSEEAYYFAASKYAPALIKYIEEHPEFIEPESRKKEMLNNFLYTGLQDLCVSRTSFRWGIPVSFDDRHVIYVWLDALFNYATALGYDPENGEDQPDAFKKYWPAEVHVIGKDILRFHTIYWPIFLMSQGLPLPKKVFGHPWFNFGADKMSKSKGNILYADDIAKRVGVDGVRYYALSEMPYAQDGSITWEAIVSRYNSDLANNLGNLVSRTVAMTKKYFGGTVPAPREETELDAELKSAVLKAVDGVYGNMLTFHVADALECIFTALRRANKYIDETTPWTLAKGGDAEHARLGTVIYNLLESIRICAVLLYPFIPASSDAIMSSLGTDMRDYDALESFGGLAAGGTVGDAAPLFARIDEEKLLAEIAAERAAKEKAAEAEESKGSKAESARPEGVAEIGIDDFMGVELRTAEVVACERVPKAKKLLKLQLDLGYEKRQVVSGIAKWYAPEDLVGKKVIVVANLKPATLCGVESRGMILASGEDEVRVVFLAPDTPNGERVR